MHKFISGLYGMKKHGEDQFLCHPYYLLLHFLSILISIHQVVKTKLILSHILQISFCLLGFSTSDIYILNYTSHDVAIYMLELLDLHEFDTSTTLIV